MSDDAGGYRLVSVYVNEGDEWKRRPLHLALLELFHHEGIAGGTVLRAAAGFTGHGGVRTTSLVDAGGRLPLVVQFVDTEVNAARVIPHVREMAGNRLITVQPVDVVP